METHEDKEGSNHHQKHMSFKRKTCKEIQEDHDELHEKNHNCLGMDREMYKKFIHKCKKNGQS
jgi:hypothetical protein